MILYTDGLTERANPRRILEAVESLDRGVEPDDDQTLMIQRAHA
jgi:hypothetical protein